MLMLFKILFFLIIILTIRGITPRYKVDILITVVWKQLLVISAILLMVLLI